LIITSPILLIIAIAVKIDSKGPIIFKQERIGKKGKVFRIYKFRSMCVGAEKTGSGVYSGKGDARVTKVGRVLRATSLDELPQLFNVFKGDMSFIGPRPPLTYHPWVYEKYTEEQKKMFDVRPGITGWAQINGRKEVEWHKRIELNVWYVEHLSFWLDIKIVFKTVFKVFSNANNENTGATVQAEPEVAVAENAPNGLTLMYITNSPEVAKIAEQSGVERIFVDMEYIGKSDRQGGMDTVQSRHTIEDVQRLRDSLTHAELLVRCNPIHEKTEEYGASEDEIDQIVESGADVIMLPYFKSAQEAEKFIRLVGGRAKTLLLVETPEAVERIDEILALDGIDEIFIGLNDLSIGYGKKFMFELLTDGTVERLCEKFKARGIPYGFGGIAAIGKGLLPSEKVIQEHYRLGSTRAILSRSFCNTNLVNDLTQVQEIFDVELKKIREWENKCATGELDFDTNREEVKEAVEKIVESVG
jgi:lipopolysaccharide/colanic/teichoic acid biosynthesis glycosyltransferase/2-keto-3-deoxy-L-rhamnonate aldolase RhmA